MYEENGSNLKTNKTQNTKWERGKKKKRSNEDMKKKKKEKEKDHGNRRKRERKKEKEEEIENKEQGKKREREREEEVKEGQETGIIAAMKTEARWEGGRAALELLEKKNEREKKKEIWNTNIMNQWTTY